MYASITPLGGTKLKRSQIQCSQHVKWRYHLILYNFYDKNALNAFVVVVSSLEAHISANIW